MDVQFSFFRKRIWLLSQLEGNVKRLHNNVISLLEPTYMGSQVVGRPDPALASLSYGYLSRVLGLMTYSEVLCLLIGPRVCKTLSKRHLRLLN